MSQCVYENVSLQKRPVLKAPIALNDLIEDEDLGNDVIASRLFREL